MILSLISGCIYRVYKKNCKKIKNKYKQGKIL